MDDQEDKALMFVLQRDKVSKQPLRKRKHSELAQWGLSHESYSLEMRHWSGVLANLLHIFEDKVHSWSLLLFPSLSFLLIIDWYKKATHNPIIFEKKFFHVCIFPSCLFPWQIISFYKISIAEYTVFIQYSVDFLHLLLCHKCFSAHSRSAYFSMLWILVGIHWMSVSATIRTVLQMVSFYPYSNLTRWVPIVFPFCRCGLVAQRLNLPEVIQPEVAFWFQRLNSFAMFHC